MADWITTSRWRGGLPLAAVVATFAYGAVAALFAPFTWSMRIATAVPCLALVVLAVARGWHRPRVTVADAPTALRRPWKVGLVVWVVLIGLTIAFQLLNFFAWPRTVYPTLSSLAAQVFHIYPIRAAVLALWLWFGWYLLDR